MNFGEMQRDFDRIQRTLQDTTFSDYRDVWLNQAWKRISEMFCIPNLIRSITFDSVNQQQKYLFPYDYNGTEVFLYYKEKTGGTSRRLDPVTEDVLAAMYEKRSGAYGPVWYYDMCGNVGTDLASRSACTVTNGSTIVTTANANVLDIGYWVRFDPWVASSITVNPGEYGYQIITAVAGVSYTLDRPYRGPSTTTTTTAMRVRPAEQSQFITYGIPQADVDDAFSLRYYAKPQRMQSSSDVPEFPSAGEAIIYMAIALGFDFLTNVQQSQVWQNKALERLISLQRRREVARTLNTDLTIGSVTGRKTGARSVDLGRRYGYGY